MFARIKKLFANFTWSDFFIGGFNFGAGGTMLNAGWNNYLYFDTSLRMIGIIIVLGFCGSLLCALELLPRPDFVQRHISHLNSYIGRAVTYLLLACITSDTANQKQEHKFYLYLTWLCAISMAFYAIFFALLSICDTWIRPIPRPKSMNYSKSLKDGKKDDALEMNKESAWTVSPADGEVSYSAPDAIIPYGDPFDQASIAPSTAGWTQHPVKGASSSSGLSFTNFNQSCPSINGASHSSYGYQSKVADSCYLYGDETHVINLAAAAQQGLRTPRSRDNLKASISSPLKRAATFDREYNSSRDHLLLPSSAGNFHNGRGSHQSSSTNDQFPQSASSILTSTTNDWIAKASENQQHSPSPFGYAGYERDTPVQQVNKLKRASTRKHKRVYVPGIGSFDLSSGSESEGEEKGKSQIDLLGKIKENNFDNDDDDAASVYSLDSNVGDTSIGKPSTTLGRKLTRTETLTYRNKLDRGMQRARNRATAARI